MCREIWLVAATALLGGIGCGGEDPPETPTPELLGCQTHDSPEIVIGSGTGGIFTPLSDGDEVSLVVAPQGGFGVAVWVQSDGLKTDDSVDVLLETAIDDMVVGSFLNEGISLYCQDDGSGMLWGVVVGFDPGTYSSNDDLLALNGEVVELLVRVTDTEGRVAHGSVDVTIIVSN